MTIFSRVSSDIKENVINIKEGNVNCIPWMSLPKFGSVMPGVMKKSYYQVTAGTKVGKTQITDFLFILEPYNFIKKHPETGLKVKVLYFLLEMSKEEKILSYISHYLYQNNNIRKAPLDLMSMFEGKCLEDEIITLIDNEYNGFFDEFEQSVEIHDSITNPYGIYQKVKEYAYANGSYVDKKGIKIKLEDIKKGTPEVLKSISHYKPNDPNEYVIIVTDHVGLLTPEKAHNGSLFNAISDFSSNRCLDIKKKFGYTVVNVQQQMPTQEQEEYTFRGSSIIEKLKPSVSGLGDCKLTSRDVDVMLGLFAPARYNTKTYAGYDLTRLKDKYRELSIILNRKGGGLQSVDLLFDGAVNYFKELPSADQMTNAHYNKIINNQF